MYEINTDIILKSRIIFVKQLQLKIRCHLLTKKIMVDVTYSGLVLKRTHAIKNKNEKIVRATWNRGRKDINSPIQRAESALQTQEQSH